MWKPLVLAIGLSVVVGAACSDDGDSLTAICEKAKDRQCTDISGNCGEVVAAFDSAADKAGCNSEFSAYQACALEVSDVCDVDLTCSSQLDALGNCVGVYCLANSNDADCAVLLQEFQ